MQFEGVDTGAGFAVGPSEFVAEIGVSERKRAMSLVAAEEVSTLLAIRRRSCRKGCLRCRA